MKRIQVIIPKKLLPDGKAVARVLKNAARMAGEQLRSDFEATTNTWSKRPEFKREDIGIGSVEVSTDNFIWNMLDAGTKPHIIVPKRAKLLRFAWDGFGSYGAKTKPNKLSSGSARYPKRIVFRRRVRHPGTAPRNWVETAYKKWEPKWAETVQRALHVEDMMRSQ